MHICYAIVGIHAQEQGYTVHWIRGFAPTSRLVLSAPRFETARSDVDKSLPLR